MHIPLACCYYSMIIYFLQSPADSPLANMASNCGRSLRFQRESDFTRQVVKHTSSGILRTQVRMQPICKLFCYLTVSLIVCIVSVVSPADEFSPVILRDFA